MAFAQEALRLAVVNAGLLGLIAAPTYTVLRDTSQRQFLEILNTNQIPHEVHKSENMITLTELGSEIIFRTMDNPHRLIGTNLAWFGVDELTYCKSDSYLRLQARLRHPLAKELCGFAAWTPKGFDWVYDRFIGPEARPGYTAILAKPYENRHLPNDFYPELMASYDTRFAAQEVLGEYLNLQSGQAYYSFSRSENLRSQFFQPSLPIYWSLDFNVCPMSSVITQIEQGTRGRLLNVLDEISLRDSSVWKACDEFVARTGAWVQRAGGIMIVRVYGDASGGSRQHATGNSSYHMIREFFSTRPEYRVTYHHKQANPPIRDRVNAVNALLCNSEGERRCLIDPKCRQTVRDLEQVVWEADSNGNSTGGLDQSTGLTHISDALGYLIETEFGLHQRGGPRSTFVA